MSIHRCLWLLLLFSASATGTGLTEHHCADAAGRQAAMRRIVQAVPPQGLSSAQVKQALDSLDDEWKHAFGDTAARPRYQEAVEEYASRARHLVTVAQRPDARQLAPIDPLALARREEDMAYAKLQEQARLACPTPPS